jgi:hypothetical protein
MLDIKHPHHDMLEKDPLHGNVRAQHQPMYREAPDLQAPYRTTTAMEVIAQELCDSRIAACLVPIFMKHGQEQKVPTLRW